MDRSFKTTVKVTPFDGKYCWNYDGECGCCWSKTGECAPFREDDGMGDVALLSDDDFGTIRLPACIEMELSMSKSAERKVREVPNGS
mgnify:CR=1 FL=1